ncbi:MAG: HAD family hydrolase [Tissierellia bacterium]|nr:HAD family hydrolase [Tissierellia bacterium]
MRIFASDLDGTLLNKNHKFSNKSLEALKIIENLGMKFVAVSGRVYESIRYLTDSVGIKSCIIANNGALIIDESGNEIYRKPISKESLKQLIKLSRKYNLDYQLYDKDTYYSDKFVFDRVKHLHVSDDIYQVNFCIRDDIDDFAIDNVSVLKFFMFVDVSKCQEFIEEVGSIDGVRLTVSGARNIDITHKDVNKGNGLEILSKYLDIPMGEFISIGDYDNDFEMLDKSGYGIAMGNAVEKLKQIADYVTLTNDEEGFYHAVIKIKGDLC